MIQTIFNLAMNLGIGFIAEFQLPFISGGYVNSLTNYRGTLEYIRLQKVK